MTRSRILPIQTAMHFAGLAIDKMQAALGRPGQKPTRPGSLLAASFVVPKAVWAMIRPGILALAEQFGLEVQEHSSYSSPDAIEIDFAERSPGATPHLLRR